MRAELYRVDGPATAVAVATWSGAGASLEVLDATVDGLGGLLRAIPVVVDDGALRHLGSHGESVLQPGSVEWFRAALLVRSPPLGLSVRFVAADVRNGWDPAANYRTFEDQARRIVSD